MSRRRHEVRGGRGQPARRSRRRRGFIARAGERGVALTVLAVAGVAIAGVAVAGAISNGGGTSTVRPESVSTPALPTTSPAASAHGPVPLSPTPTATESPSPTPRPTHTATPTPKATPKPTPTPSPTATVAAASSKPAHTGSSSSCPPAAKRVSKAGQLLQHRDALPQVSLITAGPRQGLLGASDAQARTLTLYVRSCSEESTLELAVVWGYEAGQFIKTEAWDSGTRSRWNQLRGSNFSSSAQFKQDAASVFAFWQTGSTQYWQSPVAPPSYNKLSQLVPYLKVS